MHFNTMTSASERHSLEIRPLRTALDYANCIALQHLIWGADVEDTVPATILKIAQEVGGVAAGAFDGQEMIGCVFGISGVRAGRLVHWSHMLAVREDYRDRAVGRRLKFYQRESLIELGIDTVFWTYDPLVARNAHLNIVRLGAVVEEYVDDMYDMTPPTRTDSVIGSDRLVVRWHIGDSPTPEDPARCEHAMTAHIEIPSDIQSLKLTAADEATEWRSSTRRAFHKYLDLGYHVTDFVGDSEPPYYMLARSLEGNGVETSNDSDTSLTDVQCGDARETHQPAP
ncbi:MAG: hypothetical protein ACE5HT_03230 [Gemmatimonadales bacterium]